MTPGKTVLILLAVTITAILLDLILIWSWRYWRIRRGGRPAESSPKPLPTPVLLAFEGLERMGRRLGRNAARLVVLARDEFPHDDRGRLRMAVLLACLLLSASIGYAYAEAIMVEGWQLWTWLVVSTIAVVTLMPASRVRVGWSREAWIVLGLTVASAALRLIALDRIPPGLHGDEGRSAEFTLIHVFRAPGLTLAPFRAGLYSQPTLYNYILWASMRLFGQDAIGLRLPSAIAGTLAIPMTYFAVSQVSGKRVGLFAAALLTAYHYHIHWSRLALNNVWDTLWIPAILGFFAWAWSTRWSGAAVFSGVALGLSQYFYAGNKIAVFLLPFLAYTLWRKERDTRRLLVYGAKCLAAAAVVAAPILVFASREPAMYLERWNVVLFWQPGLGPGLDPIGLAWLEAVRDQAFRAVAGFTSLTDTTGFYRAEVPLVMGLAAPLFLAGIVWAVVQRQFVPVVWVGLTMGFGGFLLTSTPSSSHYVAAIPAVAWSIALLLDGIWRHIRPWLAVVLLVSIVATDLVYYFGVYIPTGALGDFNLPFPTGPFR